MALTYRYLLRNRAGSEGPQHDTLTTVFPPLIAAPPRHTAALFGHTPVLVCTSLGFLLGMLVLLGLLSVHIWDLMMNVNGVLPIFGKHLKFAGCVCPPGVWVFDCALVLQISGHISTY